MKTTAKVLAHSKCSITGKEIVTFEIVYQRMILAELNTHRLPSKNSASSRAIPIAKVLEQVRDNPATPYHWGKNQPGMSAKEELTGTALANVQALWFEAALDAADHAQAMELEGVHKQVANRILEPFQWMKTVITSTEWDNFYHLRNHQDADPNIQALAKAMLQAYKESTPVVLKFGEWHVPYYKNGFWKPFIDGSNVDHPMAGEGFTLQDALAISSSCCAQTSFRTNDDTLDKAKRVFDKLVESKPVHASPFEHQATPMAVSKEQICNDYGNGERYYFGSDINQPNPKTWQEGITAIDRKGNFWSGNFCGFIQHRQLIPDNACWDYKELEV